MAPLYMFVVGATGILRACELAHVCSLQCIQQNQCAKTVLLLSQATKQKFQMDNYGIMGGNYKWLFQLGGSSFPFDIHGIGLHGFYIDFYGFFM